MNLWQRVKAAAGVVWRGTLSEATAEEVFGRPVPWSEFFTANGRALSPVARVYGPETRKEKNATVRTLQDHDFARNRSRVLAETNPNAAGLLERVQAYHVGKGSSTEVQSTAEGAEPPKRLGKRAEQIIKRFKENNGPRHLGWAAREKEMVWRLHVDGEFFLRFYPQADGVTKVRFVECANVRPPQGTDAEGPWSAGVHTPGGDSEEPTEYCVHDFQTQTDQIVESHFIVHAKINCLSNQKRGVPSLYACEEDLVGASKLRYATREGEKNRASINYFRRHKAADRSAIEGGMFRQPDVNVNDPGLPDNASHVYVEVIQPGSTIDIPEGLDPMPPPGSPNVEGSARSVEQALEAVAARFGVPVWVVSGKTDQGNFAQALVVESPFTVSITDFQADLAAWVDLCQTKVLEIAAEQGYLPEDVLDQIDLLVSFPSPASRNRLEESQRRKLLRDSNIISEKQWSMEEGYDPFKQRQQMIEERKDAIGYIPATIREVIRPGATQAPTPNAGTPAGDAQAKAAGNGAAPSSSPAARYAQLAGRLREQAQEFERMALSGLVEYSEDQERDYHGRFGSGGAPAGGGSKGGTAERAGGAAKPAAPAAKVGLLGRIKAALVSAGVLSPPPVQGPPWSDVAHLSVADRLHASPPRADFIDKLEAQPHRQKQWEFVAQKNGKSVEETRKDVAEKLNKMIEPLRVSMRFWRPETLMKVLDSGQFKNQFHAGVSSDAAVNDRKLRARAEQISMGVPPDAPPDERPIYGYLTYPDNEAAGVPRTLDAAQAYGDWIVNFKPEVKERMTVSYGDSLMGAVNKEFVAAAPGQAHPESMGPGVLAARGMDVLDDFAKFDQESRVYVEAHVHGKTDLSHVESIDFPKHSPPTDEMKQKLADHGVKWQVY